MSKPASRTIIRPRSHVTKEAQQHTGAGVHQDRRTKRQRTRAAVIQAHLKEFM